MVRLADWSRRRVALVCGAWLAGWVLAPAANALLLVAYHRLTLPEGSVSVDFAVSLERIERPHGARPPDGAA